MKNKINNIQMFVRENTLDEFIINEKCYEKIDYYNYDNVLDIGANIGAFCCKYYDKVNKIISFEPDNENYEILSKNVDLFGAKNIILEKKCVIGNQDETREFFLNKKRNKGAHSLLVKRGREKVTVDCININQIINNHNINVIKIDAEGAEDELIRNISHENLKKIRMIVYEYHFNILKDKNKSNYIDLVKILKYNDFIVDYKEPDRLGKSWTTIVKAIKK